MPVSQPLAPPAPRALGGRLAPLAHPLSAELDQAARYVRALLPEPLVGPVGANWVFIPSAQLGGDAFGYHWLDEHRFALYVLDVTGHGIASALHSVSVLNVLRVQGLPGTDYGDPSAVLAALNDAFPMKQFGNLYFTMWYGVFDRRTRVLTYASGGHPPALLVTGDETRPDVEPLRTPGLLIGGPRGVQYPSATRHLPPGSALFVFSDGVYEIRGDDGQMLGVDDFIDLLTEAVQQRSYCLEHLIARLNEIQDCQRCKDDMALLRFSFP